MNYKTLDKLMSKHPEKDNWSEVDIITKIDGQNITIGLAASKQKRLKANGCGAKADITIPKELLDSLIECGTYTYERGCRH